MGSNTTRSRDKGKPPATVGRKVKRVWFDKNQTAGLPK